MNIAYMEKEKQIPKIIHYCWFGGNPLPDLAKNCIASWKKYLPDYEIKEWNENNFDVYRAIYIAEAYRLKKYAFVSDYARFWILYHYGGIYFDTEGEGIRPLEDILSKGTFAGFECQQGIPLDNPNGTMNPGLGIGVWREHPFFKQMLDFYDHDHFVRWDGKKTDTVPFRVTRFLDYDHKKSLPNGSVRVSDLLIYPIDYFCPLNYFTHEMNITENTRTIHHYMASWVSHTNRWQNLRYRLKAICIRIYCTLENYFKR